MGDLSVSLPLKNYFSAQKVILIVEDSDEDFSVLTRILHEVAFSNPVYRVCDGDDALDYLYRRGVYADPAASPRPAIILIDLNLPGTDGREIIEQIKQNQRLKTIPIVVLTNSSNPQDIEGCYGYGVNSYMLKPTGIEALRRSMQNFLHYWFEIAVLPTPYSND